MEDVFKLILRMKFCIFVISNRTDLNKQIEDFIVLLSKIPLGNLPKFKIRIRMFFSLPILPKLPNLKSCNAFIFTKLTHNRGHWGTRL